MANEDQGDAQEGDDESAAGSFLKKSVRAVGDAVQHTAQDVADLVDPGTTEDDEPNR